MQGILQLGTISKKVSETFWTPIFLSGPIQAVRRCLRTSLCVAGLLFAGALPTTVWAEDALSHWLNGAQGYARALEKQRGTSDAVLVYFYTDWCPHCRSFDTSIAASPHMQDYLRHAVGVRINPEKGKQEQELADQFGATGYPSFFVIAAGATQPQRITPPRTSAAEFIAVCEAAGEKRVKRNAQLPKSTAATSPRPAAPKETAHAIAKNVIRLKNGNAIEGTVRTANDKEILLDVNGIGSLTLSRGEIAAIDGALPSAEMENAGYPAHVASPLSGPGLNDK